MEFKSTENALWDMAFASPSLLSRQLEHSTIQGGPYQRHAVVSLSASKHSESKGSAATNSDVRLPSCSRRRALIAICTAAAVSATPLGESLIFPFAAEAADDRPGLPPGAQQFNNLRSARMKWDQIEVRLRDADKAIEDDEWNGLRSFLRVFYKVGDDMTFIASNWKPGLKDQAKAIVKKMQKTLKDMDKVAVRKERDEFLNMHVSVTSLVDDFYALLKEATVSDIPEDL